MRILKGVEIPITICVSYTVLSITNAILSLANGHEYVRHTNSFHMLLWTSIAVLVLSIHYLFEEWSPVAMILAQYLIAMGLVFFSIFIGSFFLEVAEHGYRDAFISFTVPYMIGGAFYYFSVFQTARRQNRLIQEIQSKTESLSA